MQSIRDHKDLNVWQKGKTLVRQIYQATADFPPTEKYGLMSQMQRASVSIPANIAEGYMRGRKEYVHFLSIAAASASELETLVILSSELEFLPEKRRNILLKEVDDLRRMLYSMRKKLSQTPKPKPQNP